MRKHKMLLIFVIIVVLFAAFVVTVIFIFNSILNNPIDSISISYIRDNTNIEKEYGKIIYIGRNILYKTKEDDFSIKRPYTIETVSGEVVVYVALIKGEKEWMPRSLEVIEVIPNEW